MKSGPVADQNLLLWGVRIRETDLYDKNIFVATYCVEMGFDSGRVEQIADFSPFRLLLARADLCIRMNLIKYQ
jgi:hypothetical protein